MLSKNQKLFAETLLQTGNDSLLNTLLEKYSVEEAEARLSIYKNNFYRSLSDILIDIFPGVQQLVGNDYFDQLAQSFIINHPPTTPIVSLYGEDLPNFLMSHPISNQLPYISDCASLEWALHSAYYKKDADAIAPEEFLEIDTEQLMQCQFEFHPATQLIQSKFSIYTIHEFLNSENHQQEIRYDTPENVLISRHELSIEHYLVETGISAFIEHLILQKSLEQAITDTMEEHSEFDPMQAVGFLIQTQTVINLRGIK